MQAQPADAKTEVIGGKTYYVHFVEAGNTLYGIHQLYGVAPEEILGANPGMTDQLEIGQKILIPAKEAAVAKDITHTVLAGETLYGISKKYKCTLEEIAALNPGVNSGIAVGQVLRIPNKSGEFIPVDPVIPSEKPTYQVKFEDSIVIHTVLAQETMYSISKRFMVSIDTIIAVNGLKSTKVKAGDVLKIPLKKVNYTILEKDLRTLTATDTMRLIQQGRKIKSVYKVALMMPFELDANEAEMSKTFKTPMDRQLYPSTKITYAFYQGFMMAADSLRKAGLNVKLYVYDTKQDSARLIKFFNDPEFADMDLVIGPLHDKMTQIATRICKERNIRIVLPFRASPKILQDNPYVFSSVSSNMTLTDAMVDYVADNMSHYNVLIVKPYSASDKALYERARDRYNSRIQGKTGVMNPQIKEIDLGAAGGREMNAYILKDTVNVILVPSEEVKFVSGALSRMNGVMNINPYAKKLKVISFGYEDWNGFDDIDLQYRNRTFQHYASFRFADLNTGRGLQFVKAFRAKYGIDPDIYSTQGFDVALYFLSALHLYGVNFDADLANHSPKQIQNKFRFEPVANGSGSENKGTCVVRYNNFTLVKVN